MQDLFRKIAVMASKATGSPWAFIIAILTVLAWAATYPLYSSADSWLLLINSITTIVTYLLVFVIQSSQNRDTTALQIKLDELIRVSKSARNRIAGAEELPDEDLKEFHKEFVELEDGQDEIKVQVGENKEHVGKNKESVKKVDNKVDHVEDEVQEIKNH